MNLSITEILLIAVVALVVIGPKRLPDVAKSVGKGYAEFRKAFDDLKKSVDISSEDTPAVRRTKNTENTYKSRWEEQLPESSASETQEQNSAQENSAQEAQTEQPVRAKRGDLVKEDENGNG